MMKIKTLLAMTLATMSFIACDDTTGTLGNSLSSSSDQFETICDTFNVTSRSIAVDSVIARSTYPRLGKVKDPETGAYVTSHYTTQFSMIPLVGESTVFPDRDSIYSKDAVGNIIADSCKLRICFASFVGDTLNPMKLTVYELSEAIPDGVSYYSDFDPEAMGLIREDGIQKSKMYSIYDLHYNDSIRGTLVDGSSVPTVTLNLNDPYTDRNGNVFNNYGSYLLNKYYENPAYFNTSYSFAHEVCPGFYIKSTDGLGVMSEVYFTDMTIYYKINTDSIYNVSSSIAGTEEVLQTMNIINDKESVTEMIGDQTCTYLKSPAGIFTEVDLPILDIMKGHENDTLTSAKIVFPRYNREENIYIDMPNNVLMVPKDSLYSFFEMKNVSNSKTSYLGTTSNTDNTYTFSNISTLVTTMYKNYTDGKASSEWNKVVLVPVSVTASTSSSASTITSVNHDMSLTSVKLVGGEKNSHKPLKISVIYNRFDDK